MTAISSVPAVLDDLFAKATAVCATVPTAQAFDGPARVTTPQQYLAIGVAGHQGETAVAGTGAIADLGSSQDKESYAIACQASSWAGNGAFKPLRDQAFALINALAALIAKDRRLGGACMQARIAVLDYSASIGSKGPTVVVPFHVQIEAMRRNS